MRRFDKATHIERANLLAEERHLASKGLLKEEASEMSTLRGIANYFSGKETKSLSNEAAGYQFVKRADGVMLQFSNGEYKFYKTFDGFIKAVLWRVKRG